MNKQQERGEMDQADILHVRGVYEEEVSATYAELFVTVQGASLIAGDIALQKAREVNQLVTDLKNSGLTDEDIQLLGVRAAVSSGILGKSSAAIYSLKIHCNDLTRLVDVLGCVTGQKNTLLLRIEWGFDLSQEAKDRRLTQAIERANAKARLIAQALGVKLIGVRRFMEEDLHPGSKVSHYGEETLYRGRKELAMREPLMTSEDLGLEISHKHRISIGVNVEYRISEITAA